MRLTLITILLCAKIFAQQEVDLKKSIKRDLVFGGTFGLAGTGMFVTNAVFYKEMDKKFIMGGLGAAYMIVGIVSYSQAIKHNKKLKNGRKNGFTASEFGLGIKYSF